MWDLWLRPSDGFDGRRAELKSSAYGLGWILEGREADRRRQTSPWFETDSGVRLYEYEQWRDAVHLRLAFVSSESEGAEMGVSAGASRDMTGLCKHNDAYRKRHGAGDMGKMGEYARFWSSQLRHGAECLVLLGNHRKS